jgi:hypothetical protein
MFRFIYKRPILYTLIWACIIFLLCATPGQYIPSADWLELLSFDKFVHAGMFFILTSLLLLVAIKQGQLKQMIFVYFFISIGYGALLELMQAYCFSNRSADWKDIIANSFGCIAALLFLKKIKGLYTQSQK